MSASMHPDTGFSAAARTVLVAGAFVVVVAGMRAAAPLIAPFLLSVFIAVIAAPPLRYLRGHGLPNWAAMLVVVLALVGIGIGVAVMVSGSLDGFQANLPAYQGRMRELTGQLVQWLDRFGIHIPRAALQTYIDPGKALGMAGDLIAGLSSVLANALLILLTVVFILFEATSLPAKLKRALKTPEQSTQRLEHVVDSVNQYMGIKTLTSLVTGGAIWIWLTLLGVDYAVLWGLIAFLLNFVPTIGSIVAAVPAVLLALVQIDLQTALLAAAGYLVVNLVVGNVVEPRVMGRGLGLSTLVVFISLVFWGWVLGSVGMFLSVPLTMALKVALDANPETRPIAIMLGPDVNDATISVATPAVAASTKDNPG